MSPCAVRPRCHTSNGHIPSRNEISAPISDASVTAKHLGLLSHLSGMPSCFSMVFVRNVKLYSSTRLQIQTSAISSRNIGAKEQCGHERCSANCEDTCKNVSFCIWPAAQEPSPASKTGAIRTLFANPVGMSIAASRNSGLCSLMSGVEASAACGDSLIVWVTTFVQNPTFKKKWK